MNSAVLRCSCLRILVGSPERARSPRETRAGMTLPINDVTRLLKRINDGDDSAESELLAQVYAELRGMARGRMKNLPRGQTLQPTALVHEAYLRVAGNEDARWEGRKHFYFALGRAMRDILVEQARRRARIKRGGNRERLPLLGDEIAIQEPNLDVLALSEILEKLQREKPEDAELILLLYFSGLTIDQAADVLEVSPSTVDRRWRFVRAWLRRELEEDESTS